MSLVSLLATTTLITLANSTPMIYAANQRDKIPVDHDHFLLILLLNRRDFGLKTKPMDETSSDYATGIGTSLTRDKRIGSLSIVNSVDVLRQRVLLELARRKAMEDQRMISENRRLLDSVGKRSDNSIGTRGFVYRDHRIPRKKRLQYQLDEAGDPEQAIDRLDVQ